MKTDGFITLFSVFGKSKNRFSISNIVQNETSLCIIMELNKYAEEIPKHLKAGNLTVDHQHRNVTSLMVLLGSIAAILMYFMMFGSRAYLSMSIKNYQRNKKWAVSSIR
jgi:hypothetical protein